MEIYEVIPGLFQSGYIDSLIPITDNNIRVVINLTTDSDTLVSGRVPYIRAPMIDGPLPWLEVLDACTAFGTAHVRNGYATLVHCGAGRNRSGLVNALIVRQILGISGEAAIDIVRAKVPFSLDNEIFKAYLRTLDAP